MLLFPSYRWARWGSERWHQLSKATQLRNGRAKIWTQFFLGGEATTTCRTWSSIIKWVSMRVLSIWDSALRSSICFRIFPHFHPLLCSSWNNILWKTLNETWILVLTLLLNMCWYYGFHFHRAGISQLSTLVFITVVGTPLLLSFFFSK